MDSTPSTSDLLASLLLRSEYLLSELSQFQNYLRTQKKEHLVELRSFRSSVQSEVKALRKFEARHIGCQPGSTSDKASSGVDEDEAGAGVRNSSLDEMARSVRRTVDDDNLATQQDAEREVLSLHGLRSSNIPFLHTVWTVAKHGHGIKALSKRFYHSGHGTHKGANGHRWKIENDDGEAKSSQSQPRQRSVLVDIVSANGNIWTKVSLITEKRLIFDMAKEGYGVEDSDTEGSAEDDEDQPKSTLFNSGPDLELLRLASDLKLASLFVSRIHYERPHIRLVLPRLSEGSLYQIDNILSKIRQMGISVICRNTPASDLSLPDILSTSPINATLRPDTTSLFPTLSPVSSPIPTLPNYPFILTPTLNLDCTILLALLSDISHLNSANLPPPPSGNNSFHVAVRAQIVAEAAAGERLLSGELWPVLSGRKLVTTQEAVVRMAEIVGTIGTEMEKGRVAGLFAREFALDGDGDVAASLAALNERQAIGIGKTTALFAQQTTGQEQTVTTAEKETKISEDCRKVLQSMSDYSIPSDIILPIQIVDFNIDTALQIDHLVSPASPCPFPNTTPSTPSTPPATKSGFVSTTSLTPILLPSYVSQISAPLSRINKSVFISGWALNITTITSNRGVAKEIERLVCRELDNNNTTPMKETRGKDDNAGRVVEAKGPRMYVIGTVRSLIGKEKFR